MQCWEPQRCWSRESGGTSTNTSRSSSIGESIKYEGVEDILMGLDLHQLMVGDVSAATSGQVATAVEQRSSVFDLESALRQKTAGLALPHAVPAPSLALSPELSHRQYPLQFDERAAAVHFEQMQAQQEQQHAAEAAAQHDAALRRAEADALCTWLESAVRAAGGAAAAAALERHLLSSDARALTALQERHGGIRTLVPVHAQRRLALGTSDATGELVVLLPAVAAAHASAQQQQQQQFELPVRSNNSGVNTADCYTAAAMPGAAQPFSLQRGSHGGSSSSSCSIGHFQQQPQPHQQQRHHYQRERSRSIASDRSYGNHNSSSNTAELAHASEQQVVGEAVDILRDACARSLKAVELANTLRARLGTEALAQVRELHGGLLSLLERHPALFRVDRIPKSDCVTLIGSTDACSGTSASAASVPMLSSSAPIERQLSSSSSHRGSGSSSNSSGALQWFTPPPSNAPVLHQQQHQQQAQSLDYEVASYNSPCDGSAAAAAAAATWSEPCECSSAVCPRHHGGSSLNGAAGATRCLHVGNVPSHLNEEELRAAFTQHGRIESLRLVTQRGHRFAFVNYTQIEDAVRAKAFLSRQAMWRSAISFAHRESFTGAGSGYGSDNSCSSSSDSRAWSAPAAAPRFNTEGPASLGDHGCLPQGSAQQRHAGILQPSALQRLQTLSPSYQRYSSQQQQQPYGANSSSCMVAPAPAVHFAQQQQQQPHSSSRAELHRTSSSLSSTSDSCFEDSSAAAVDPVLATLTSDHFVPTQTWPSALDRDWHYVEAIAEQLKQVGGSTTISKLRGLLKGRLGSPLTIKSVPLKALLAAYTPVFVLMGNRVALVAAACEQQQQALMGDRGGAAASAGGPASLPQFVVRASA